MYGRIIREYLGNLSYFMRILSPLAEVGTRERTPIPHQEHFPPVIPAMYCYRSILSEPMKRVLTSLVFFSAILALSSFFFPSLSNAQRHVRGIVREEENKQPVIGANVTIEDTKLGARTGKSGEFLIDLPDAAEYTVVVSAPGFGTKESEIDLRQTDTAYLVFELHEKEAHGEEVVVTGTRTERSVKDVPVRTEVVPEEEVQEELFLRPNSVGQLLAESNGIDAQTTGGLSGTQTLRIQGLPGRYTQFLANGVPNFSGVSAGFSMFEIPPLNLRQVEILKGANSVLYGADAISGVINFLTREPEKKPVVEAFGNASSLGALDAATFLSNQMGSTGVTLMAVDNHQKMVDVDKDSLQYADLPEYNRQTYDATVIQNFGEKTRLKLGTNYSKEDRIGGISTAPRSAIGLEYPYLEENKLERLSGSAQLSWQSNPEATDLMKKESGGTEASITHGSSAAFDVAGMHLKRDATYGSLPFNGDQYTYYMDGQYSWEAGIHNLLAGAAFVFDEFSDRTLKPYEPHRSYIYRTPGLFLQDEMAFGNQFRVLLGARTDFNNTFGTFVTPRASVMYKPADEISLRANVGTGWKAPTIFLDQLESHGFSYATFEGAIKAEKAVSASLDGSWSTELGDEITSTLSGALFYTRINDPLGVYDPAPSNLRDDKIVKVVTSSGPTVAKGIEAYASIGIDDLTIFGQFTYTKATETLPTEPGTTEEAFVRDMELVPVYKALFDVVYEEEDWGSRIGMDFFIVGPQRVYDTPDLIGRVADPYLTLGFMFQQEIGEHVMVFLNAENIFDARQTRREILYHSAIQGEIQENHIYMPLEGRFFSGGLRFRL